MHLMNLILKLKTFQEKELIRNIENDDNDDENLIEVIDRMKNDDCI
jgi:hypothetical protein